MWRLTSNLLLCVLTIRALPQPKPKAYLPGENFLPVNDGTTSLTASTAITTTPAPHSCPSPFELEGDQCLYFASFAEESHQECRQICHSLNGQLVAIKTATQFKRIIDLIHSQGLEHKGFWTDATDVDEEMQWVYTSGDNVPMGTPFWATSQTESTPDDKGHDQNCAGMVPGMGFLLNDYVCAESRSPLCEHDLVLADGVDVFSPPGTPDVKCPSFYVNVGGSCFSFITWADQDWSAARQTCHGLNGELASIREIEDLRSIYEYLHEEGINSHSFWIGGNDLEEEDTWVWPDGSGVPQGTPFWGNRDPLGLPEPDGGIDENCLALPAAGEHYFRDKDCMMPLNPLCSTDPL